MILQESLETIFKDKSLKNLLVKKILKDKGAFQELIKIGLSNKQPLAWRSIWVINHALDQGELQIQPYIKKIIQHIPNNKDGYQRELLRLLNRVNLHEDHKGIVFDTCMTIWADVQKASSVRYYAFLFLLTITQEYPELKNELSIVSEKRYIDTLSPGIKKSLVKKMNEMSF